MSKSSKPQQTGSEKAGSVTELIENGNIAPENMNLKSLNTLAADLRDTRAALGLANKKQREIGVLGKKYSDIQEKLGQDLDIIEANEAAVNDRLGLKGIGSELEEKDIKQYLANAKAQWQGLQDLKQKTNSESKKLTEKTEIELNTAKEGFKRLTSEHAHHISYNDNAHEFQDKYTDAQYDAAMDKVYEAAIQLKLNQIQKDAQNQEGPKSQRSGAGLSSDQKLLVINNDVPKMLNGVALEPTESREVLEYRKEVVNALNGVVQGLNQTTLTQGKFTQNLSNAQRQISEDSIKYYDYEKLRDGINNELGGIIDSNSEQGSKLKTILKDKGIDQKTAVSAVAKAIQNPNIKLMEVYKIDQNLDSDRGKNQLEFLNGVLDATKNCATNRTDGSYITKRISALRKEVTEEIEFIDHQKNAKALLEAERKAEKKAHKIKNNEYLKEGSKIADIFSGNNDIKKVVKQMNHMLKGKINSEDGIKRVKALKTKLKESSMDKETIADLAKQLGQKLEAYTKRKDAKEKAKGIIDKLTYKAKRIFGVEGLGSTSKIKAPKPKSNSRDI